MKDISKSKQFCANMNEGMLKGEHWCKTKIKGVKDWGKT